MLTQNSNYGFNFRPIFKKKKKTYKWLQLGCPDLHKKPIRSRGVSIFENPTFHHKVAQDLTKSFNKDCQVTSEHAKCVQKPSRAAPKVPLSLHFNVICHYFSSLLRGIIEKVAR